MEPFGATARRIRSGWQVLAPMPGHPEARLLLQTAAGSWFVSYQVMENGNIVEDRELNDPGMSWDQAATMMFALLVRLEGGTDAG